MKKFLTFLVALVCSFAHAEYTAENKIIKVVIPQNTSSGLGTLYQHMENYAKKQNINMIPVFKPGANGKIGLNYASEQKNDGNTILLSTFSDFVESANENEFDTVAPITKTLMVLVASNKSKLKSINDIVAKERATPGKLTWAYGSSAQLNLIDGLIKATNLDNKTVYKVPYSTGAGLHASIANGDVDLGFMMPHIANALADKGYATVVDIDETTKQAMSRKENGTALFLPKNSSADANKFWNSFVKDLLNDNEFKLTMRNAGVAVFNKPTPDELKTVINNCKL